MRRLTIDYHYLRKDKLYRKDSMIIKPPETKEDFLKVKESILELMGNPYCDQFMFLTLSDKLDNVNKILKELGDEHD